jgi:hypothetical protein
MPTVILAERYNNLRDRVNKVLGPSTTATPTFGYGQGLSTQGVIGTRSVPSVLDADKIQAQDYEDLYIDLIRIRAHQIGNAVTIDPFVVGDFETNTTNTDKIEEAYILGLETLATNIETDKFLVDSTQLGITGLYDPSGLVPIDSVRYNSILGTWQGTISHIFTVEFESAIARQEYFNAGGQVRLQASVDYTGSQAKTVDWQTILQDMGAISFAANSSYSNNSVGTGYPVGNYQLTSTYRLCYSKSGGALYARNDYEVYARSVNDTTIQFKVNFVDGSPNDPTYGVDESVFGDFRSTALLAAPIGTVDINGTTYDTVYIDTLPIGGTITNLS